MERVIDRFDAYMASAGLNDNKVTVHLNLSKGLIGKSRNQGRDLSRSLIEKILNFYKDLNPVWLLTGEGSMLNSGQQENPAEGQPAAGSSLVEYLERKIKELERENADLLQENAVLRYENQKLTPRKGDAEDAVVSLSAGAV